MAQNDSAILICDFFQTIVNIYHMAAETDMWFA